MAKTFELQYRFTRKILKKLHDSSVPIVSKDQLVKSEVDKEILEIKDQFRLSQYLADTNHGFLGINKSHGVTRFIPIITSRDLLIYYYICYLIS